MIRFGHTDIRASDIRRVKDVLRSGWLVNGPEVKKVEALFCGMTGAPYAVAMSSCTAALHAAYAYLKTRHHLTLIKVPDITHVASAHAAQLAGLRVKIVDVDPVDGIILPKFVTGAEVVVHMAGQPCEDIRPLTVEDCAHALGSRFSNGTHVGLRGLCGCFSFYPTKHITSAEGGMLITRNKRLADFSRRFRAFGITVAPEDRKKPADYDSIFVAPNYRMPDVLAAMLTGPLQRFESNRRHRERIAAIYRSGLPKDAQRPTGRPGTSWFIYQILVKRRDALIAELSRQGIQTSIHYRRPLSQMKVYRKQKTGPNARRFSEHVVSLPVHLGVTPKDAQKIVSAVTHFFTRNRGR